MNSIIIEFIFYLNNKKNQQIEYFVHKKKAIFI